MGRTVRNTLPNVMVKDTRTAQATGHHETEMASTHSGHPQAAHQSVAKLIMGRRCHADEKPSPDMCDEHYRVHSPLPFHRDLDPRSPKSCIAHSKRADPQTPTSQLFGALDPRSPHHTRRVRSHHGLLESLLDPRSPHHTRRMQAWDASNEDVRLPETATENTSLLAAVETEQHVDKSVRLKRNNSGLQVKRSDSGLQVG